MQDCLVKNEASFNLRELKLGKRNVNRQKFLVVIYSIGQYIALPVMGQCLVVFVSFFSEIEQSFRDLSFSLLQLYKCFVMCILLMYF